MTTAAPIALSATTLLVRDAPGLEVLMVERHHQIDFASGALVFPGGKTAPADSEPAWAALCDGPFEGASRAARITAVREAFEESGLLLARPVEARGEDAPLAGEEALAMLSREREAIAADPALFARLVAEARVVLALDALTPFAHWITPEGMPKRFDTHFFLAAAPDRQAATHDGRETVDSVWITPATALAEAKAGRRKMIFPTRLNVELLGASGTAAQALAAARARPIVTVLPRITRDGGVSMLHIPAEAGYAISTAPLDD